MSGELERWEMCNLQSKCELQAQVEQFKGEILELMLEMVKGSKGERQRINAELLEKRRKDFGIQKGE